MKPQLHRYARAVGLLTIVLTGCEGVLDVDVPSRLPADAITDPALADALYMGARADFECAYSNFAAFAGLFTDEWASASSIGPSTEAGDKRESTIRDYGAQGCNTSRTPAFTGFYAPLQVARYQAETAYRMLSDHGASVVTDLELKLGNLAAYAGYSLTFLGEGFCEMAIDGGPRMTPDEVLRLAEARFTTALDHGTRSGAADLVNWASIGRARVRLRLGDSAGALADARRVTLGYRKDVLHDTGEARRQNNHFAANVNGRYFTLDVSFRNLTVTGTDPRTGATVTVPETRIVGVDGKVTGQDGSTSWWYTTKFADMDSPTPLATWEEAQLIIAEIEGGQTAVEAINRIRDAAPGGGLPHFASSDPAEIRATVIEERRRVLFGQAQRIADILRLPEVDFRYGARPLKPQTTYSDEFACIPLPWVEVNNNSNF